jgi:hypothetical protein
MIISPSREFIFIHLEKCGGTSIETALEPYLSWDDLIIGSTNFGEQLQSLYFKRFGVDKTRNEMLWKHSSAQQIYQFLNEDAWNQFKKIALVRSPESLMISLYNFSNMVAKHHLGTINRGIWKEMLRLENFPQHFPFSEGYIVEYARSVVDGSGIDGFVENVLKEEYSFCSPQYYRLTSLNRFDIDLTIDLSNLQSSWGEVLNIVGLEDVNLPHINNSEKISAELSPRSIKKIKKHFAIDYQELPKYTGVSW